MTYTPPVWAPLAVAALARLRNEYVYSNEDLRLDGRRPWQRRERAERPERKMSDRNSEPLDWLAASPTATQIPLDAQEAVLDAGGDPLAVDGKGRDRPAVHVPATDLALMFRLCATIGSQECIAGIMAPDAITLIEIGEDTGDMSLSDVRLMLAATILPEGAALVPPERIDDPRSCPDLCVVEIGSDDWKKVRLTQEATQALVRGFEAPHPVLILTEDHTAVPDDIRRAFGLRVMPRGRESFVVQYQARRRRRRMSLGPSTILTCD